MPPFNALKGQGNAARSNEDSSGKNEGNNNNHINPSNTSQQSVTSVAFVLQKLGSQSQDNEPATGSIKRSFSPSKDVGDEDEDFYEQNPKKETPKANPLRRCPRLSGTTINDAEYSLTLKKVNGPPALESFTNPFGRKIDPKNGIFSSSVASTKLKKGKLTQTTPGTPTSKGKRNIYAEWTPEHTNRLLPSFYFDLDDKLYTICFKSSPEGSLKQEELQLLESLRESIKKQNMSPLKKLITSSPDLINQIEEKSLKNALESLSQNISDDNLNLVKHGRKLIEDYEREIKVYDGEHVITKSSLSRPADQVLQSRLTKTVDGFKATIPLQNKLEATFSLTEDALYPDKRSGSQNATAGISAGKYAAALGFDNETDPRTNRSPWEWSHLRASSLGGGLVGNLVATSAACNTHMMIAELLAKILVQKGCKVEIKVSATLIPGTLIAEYIDYVIIFNLHGKEHELKFNFYGLDNIPPNDQDHKFLFTIVNAALAADLELKQTNSATKAENIEPIARMLQF